MHTNGRSAHGNGVEPLSSLLGWFSIGLGATEVLAPHWLARKVGMSSDRASTLRLCGVREIASGVGVLSPKISGAGLWARVAGDAIDLSLLGRDYTRSDLNGARRKRLNLARAAVIGVSALDLLAALRQSGDGLGRSLAEPLKMREAISINRPPEELYSYWRQLTVLPKFINYLEWVDVIDDRLSHWAARIGERTIEWESEITNDKPGQLIEWRSVEGSDFDHVGSVSFMPLAGRHGSVVTLDMQYELPAGKAGRLLTKFFKSLSKHKLLHDLRRFKQIMEAGEIATTEGQPAGRARSETGLDRIAQI